MSAAQPAPPPSAVAVASRALARHRLPALAVAAAVLAVAVTVVFSLTPTFRASVLVVLDTREIRFAEGTAVMSGPNGGVNVNIARSETEILGSDAIARQVVAELGLVGHPEFSPRPSLASRLRGLLPRTLSARLDRTFAAPPPSDEEDLEGVIGRYRRAVTIFNDGRSYAITVTVQAADRLLAAAAANRHAGIYVERQRAAKDAALALATRWLDQEVEALAAGLREAERRVREYRTTHRLFSARGTSIVEQQLADLAGELSRGRADLATQEGRAGQARASGIGRQLEAEAAGARLRVAELQRLVADLETRLAETERYEAEARDLEREAAASRSIYESLLARQKQVAAQAGAQLPDAQIASPAVAPVRPAFPNKALFLSIGLMLAAGAGLGVALLLDRRRTGVETEQEAEAALGLRVLAPLPRLPRRASLPGQVVSAPRSEAAEAVRTLRSALATMPKGTPRTIAVTSALPGEGKTSVALALARSLAGSGLHVLLVEADLRRGSVARMAWRQPPRRGARGVAAVLSGEVALGEAVREDGAGPVQILAAEGRSESAQDLLEPGRLRRVLETARVTYDYVVVDTPPVGAVSDALLVGRAVEATLLVVRADSTPVVAAAAAVRACREAGLTLAGAVLNAADPSLASPGGASVRRRARAYLDA